MKTRLWHNLPAVLESGVWTVISADFDNIANIPEGDIDKPEIFEELNSIDFFKTVVSTKNVFQLTLITTSDCSLKCRYCFANSGETALVMSDDLAKAAIDYAFTKVENKMLSIAFFGGEPSLTENLIRKTVKYAKNNLPLKSRGVEFSITTNGMISKKFVNYLIENNFLITLSADGPAHIQNYHRPTKSGGKSSSRVEKTIRSLAEAGVRFKLRVTVTDYSVNQMPEIVSWFKGLGGKEIHFEPVTISGRAALKTGERVLNQPSAETFSQGLKDAIMIGCKEGVGIINSSFMNIASPPPEFCEGHAGKRIAVSYSGDVTTCVEVQDKCHQASKNFLIGYYDKEKKEIVITRETRTTCSGFVMPKCQDCFAVRVCGGGCPVRNFHATGSLETIDGYRCKQITTMLPFIIKLCDEASRAQ